MHSRYWIFTLIILFCSDSLWAEDWPSFRGPLGNGISAERSAPIEWGPEKNIKWKAVSARPGNGSPIVSKGRVFMASTEDDDGKQRSLYCFDRATGGVHWVKTVSYGKKMPTHQTNPYGGSTPASDGQRVVVWHGSAGLHCYDHDGHLLWFRDFGEFRHLWGYGTSPIFHGNRVILHSGPGKEVFVAALDANTGDTIWKTSEPQEGNGESREDGRYVGSWCTPVLVQANGREQLICTMSTRIVAYDPDDGAILWECKGIPHDRGNLAYSSPVVAGDVCVVIGGYKGPGIGVRLGGHGDVTDELRLWRRPENPQSIGSGVVVDGHIYRPNAGPGTIDCLDPNSGDVLWTERAGEHWGSMIYVAGRCYVTNQSGVTTVFTPSPSGFQLVAKNELGSPSNSTPAVSNGELFIRTADYLFCIAED